MDYIALANARAIFYCMKNIFGKLKRDNQNGSRKKIIEELFMDFNRSRADVYKINFVRGIFFGLGSVLGGTIVVAIFIWLLSLFVDLPGIGNGIQQLQQTIQSGER